LRTLKENATDDELQEYGLDKPCMKVFVKLKDGKEEGPVLMGDKSPFGGYVYMRKTGDKAIYLANVLFRKGLDKPLYKLRDKTILHTDQSKLNEVELKTAGGRVKVIKEKKGKWRIEEPRSLKADGEAINKMLTAIRDSSIKKFFAEEPKSFKPYGLDKPEYQYTFSSLKDGSTETLLIGKPVEGADLIYARYGSASKVFALGKDLWAKMRKSLYDLRYKKVLTFTRDDIKKIEIDMKGVRLVSERGKDKEWLITSPRKLKGDYYEINGYLGTLKSIEATRFLGARLDNASSYGFKFPIVTVRLWPENAKKPITLTVGKEVEGNRGRYALSDSVDELVTISDKAVKKLMVDINDFRDRVITSFKEESVKKMVVKFRDKPSMILERIGKDEWKLVEPVVTKVNSLRAKSILWRLEALRFNDIISEAPVKEEARYGFDNPSARVALWGKDESRPLEVVTIGGPAIKKANVYVRVSSRPGVYPTDADLLDRIPKNVEEFKRKL
jgi:hypothetical protein